MSDKEVKFDNGSLGVGRKTVFGIPSLPSLVGVPDSSPAMDETAGKLARLIVKAVSGEKNMVLFGDFDVDGTSSAAVMFMFARLCGVSRVEPFVSKRSDDYGLTEKAISRLLSLMGDPSKSVVVMMDMGVSSTREAGVLLAEGCDVIVIDHHVPKPSAASEWAELGDVYGDRLTVYDPLLCQGELDRYFSCLSAAGLTFKLCMAIMNGNMEGLADKILSHDKVSLSPGGALVSVEAVVNSMSKCAAIAQAADCMPFARDGNVTASWWLAKDFETLGPLTAGIEILYKKTNTASRIAWVIGPVLNAAGRLDDAFAAFDLLIETDLNIANDKLKAIETVRERVRAMTANASITLDEDLFTKSGVAVLVADPSKIKSGVIGIAAARASEKYKAPALYLCPQEDSKHGVIFKGSMRRGETNFSCEEWILKLRENGLLISGGGHPAAAGLALKEDMVEELLRNAEGQKYDLELPPIHRVSVAEAKEYKENLEKVLPFGRGHESGILEVVGILQNIKPLMTVRDGVSEIWAFSLRMTDPENSDGVEVKIITSDLDPKSRELIAELVEQKVINAPFKILATVRDGFKHNSRYARTELRGFSVPVIIKTDDPEQKSRSGNVTSFGFLSKESFKSAFGSRPDQTVKSQQGAKGDGEVTASSIEPEIDIEKVLSSNDRRVVLEIDWNQSMHRRVFSLRKPPKWELEGILGVFETEALGKLHGGRWNEKLKCYIISAATVQMLVDNKLTEADKWRFAISESARNHHEDLKKELDIIAGRKEDVSKIEVPFLREGKTPLGFQYADVRIYLERPFAICHNDMGTGKTFEASMWGALRYCGAKLDENRKVVMPAEGTHDKKPVLVVTLKAVMGQFADEIEAFLNVKAAQISTTEVREILEPLGELKGVGSSDTDEADDGDGRKKLKPLQRVSDRTREIFRKNVLDGHAFLVTTYDCVARNPWIVTAYDWSGVVFDEAHELKTVGTNKTNALLGPEIDGSPLGGAPVLVLSGTLTKNRPADWFVWMRMTGADGGIYTAGSISSAKTRFDMRFDGMTFEKMKLRDGREITKSAKGEPENGEELKRIMYPFVVRRLKIELSEFPPINVVVKRGHSSGLYLDVLSLVSGAGGLSDKSQALLKKYKLLATDGGIKSEKVEVDKGETGYQQETLEGVNLVDAASLAGKLALIASLDKASSVMEILKDLKWVNGDGVPDEPFVVISMFRSSTLEIADRLAASGIDHFLMMQEDSADKRRAKATAFARGEKMAFVTTYGVGGTGINLTRANRILLISIPYTETLMSQARDRVHRIGQNRPVQAVIPLLSASIDEAIWGMVSQKGRANFATMSVDRVKKDALPSWAKGSIAEQATSSGTPGFSKSLGRRPGKTGPDNKEFVKKLNAANSTNTANFSRTSPAAAGVVGGVAGSSGGGGVASGGTGGGDSATRKPDGDQVKSASVATPASQFKKS